MARRPRLRTVLLLVNLVVLALPISGIAFLRLYESVLVRQTEAELNAQGAFIAAAYRAALGRLAPLALASPGYGVPATAVTPPRPDGSPWRPRAATLDLATDVILAPPPDAAPAGDADPVAAAVGADLAPIIDDAHFVTLAGIRLVDFNGIVVASTGIERGESLRNRFEVVRALAGEHVSVLRERILDGPAPRLSSISRGAHVRVFVATPVLADGRVLAAVVLSRTPRDIAAALYGYGKRHPLAWSALALLLLVIALSAITSLAISRPVRALVLQARRAIDGEKGAVTPLARPGTREVDELSHAVAALAETLEQRADYIRTFASHVSHEFKTPLTATLGAIELLRDQFDEMSADDRARFLGNMERDAHRLERLVRQLLELARADVTRVGHDDRASVGEVIERLARRYRERGLALAVTPPPGPMVALMNADVLDSIVSGLLDNATQHGGDAVRVELRCARASGAAALGEITVSDDGPGIQPADAGRAFDPFFTTARERGGTGLGLAVARSLLAAHRGEIGLLPSPRGAALRITVPLAA